MLDEKRQPMTFRVNPAESLNPLATPPETNPGRPAQPGNTAYLGPCTIWFDNQHLVIDSTVPIPDLVLREFARIRIYYADKPYCLIDRSQSSGRKTLCRYVLAPWPAAEQPGHSMVFDEDYVDHLVEWRKQRRLESCLYHLLFPFYPVLGFSWSAQKRSLRRMGFEVKSLSGLANMAGFCLGLMSWVFFVLSGLWILVIIGLAFFIDSAVRFSRSLRNDDSLPPGFYEWLFRPKRQYD
jgi:hypothetical protein